MHRLLQRQLGRFCGSAETAPADWPAFVDAIDAAYRTADDDLRRTERSLELMSAELNERNGNLRAEIAQRRVLEEQLQESIRRLQRKNEQISQLNSMGDQLQLCRSLEPAYRIIAEALQRLFATDAGVITVRDDDSDALLSVATWGDVHSLCEGLTDNRCALLTPDQDRAGGACPFGPHPTLDHLCLQLSAHGQLLGLIHVLLKKEAPELTDESLASERQQLVQATSDHISLAIDNLKLQESLRQQTIRDPLTGLYNRRHMEVSLDREMFRAQRSGKPLGVIMLDVDHFKRINDQFGHQAGDAVLKSLGAFLNRQVRGEDIACRFGGEEFMLILPGADLKNTVRRARQICLDVTTTLRVEFGGAALGELTVSIGVAAFPDHGKASVEIVKAADSALYNAKEHGRNQVVVANATVGA